MPGLKWAYEPVCFAGPDGQWLPDFRVDGATVGGGPLYVEVKPADYDEAGLVARLPVVWDTDPAAAVAIWSTTHFAVGDGTFPAAGPGGPWGRGRLGRCPTCTAVVVDVGYPGPCPACGCATPEHGWEGAGELPLTDWERVGPAASATGEAPFDRAAEEALIAAMLAPSSRAVISEAASRCRASDFSSRPLGDIFAAIVALDAGEGSTIRPRRRSARSS